MKLSEMTEDQLELAAKKYIKILAAITRETERRRELATQKSPDERELQALENMGTRQTDSSVSRDEMECATRIIQKVMLKTSTNKNDQIQAYNSIMSELQKCSAQANLKMRRLFQKAIETDRDSENLNERTTQIYLHLLGMVKKGDHKLIPDFPRGAIQEIPNGLFKVLEENKDS